MSVYLTLPGEPALSPFRKARLLEQLKRIEPRVADLAASFFYVIWSDSALDASSQALLA